MGSKILFNAVKRISNDFPILKEARREVLEDLMDSSHAQEIITKTVNGDILVEEVQTQIPSPFAFGLIASGYSDVIRIEDKHEFLRRMHQMVQAKIALKGGKEKIILEKEFSYQKLWEETKQKNEDAKDELKEKMKMQVWSLKHVPVYAKEEFIKLIENGSMRQDVLNDCRKHRKEIEETWPEELKDFMLKKISY